MLTYFLQLIECKLVTSNIQKSFLMQYWSLDFQSLLSKLTVYKITRQKVLLFSDKLKKQNRPLSTDSY